MSARIILTGAIAAICGIVLGAGVCYIILRPTSGDSGGSALPYSGKKPPAELETLGGYVGTWKIAETGEAQQYKGKFTSTGEMGVRWSHNRQYLVAEGHITRDIEGKPHRIEYTSFMTYDRERARYRRWLFSSEGFVSEVEGDWDAGARTMTWRATNQPLNTATDSKWVLNRDRYEFTIRTVREDDDSVVFALSSKGERMR